MRWCVHFSIVTLVHGILLADVACKNFTAVTNFNELIDLYLKTRAREQHTGPDINSNSDEKRDLCRTITSSGYFKVLQEDPVNIDQIYDELKSEDIKQKKWGFYNLYYQYLIANYRKRRHSTMVYPYPLTKVNFSLDFQEKLPEYAFPCLTRNRTHKKLRLYFVTDPYNINTALDPPSDKQIYARFLCLTMHKFCRLVAIAEEPAVALSKASTEKLYLQMRKFNNAVEDASNDPLCRLTKSKKFRICGSVLNSSYFADKVKYLPDFRNFEDKCNKQKVSFRTSDEAKKQSKDTEYREWMLPCSAVTNDNSSNLTYFVSRAYNSHYVFVYTSPSSDEDWYLETLMRNISPIIDKNDASEDNDKLSTFDIENILASDKKIEIKSEYIENTESESSEKRTAKYESTAVKREYIDDPASKSSGKRTKLD